MHMKPKKNIPRGFWHTRPYLHRVQEQPFSFNRPYRAPNSDLMIFEKISGLVYLFYILYSLGPVTILEQLIDNCIYQGSGVPL